jgi:hypothetical protein
MALVIVVLKIETSTSWLSEAVPPKRLEQWVVRSNPARGPFLPSPLAPRGEICPLGVKFTPSFTLRGEHYCLEEWRGEQRISPPGDNFTPMGQIHPWRTTSPLGVKVCPQG